MTGTESGDGNGEKHTDQQHAATDGGVRARVSGRWDAAEYNIDDVDEWDDLGCGYDVEKVTPKAYVSSGESELGGWLFDDDSKEIPERKAGVYYGNRGVSIYLEGKRDDIRASSEATLTPEQARRLGAALYQAGEELERWSEASEGEEE